MYMKYVIEVTETLVKHVVVEADGQGEAEIIANDAYNEEKIILDSESYLDTEFKCIREADEDDIKGYETIQN